MYVLLYNYYLCKLRKYKLSAKFNVQRRLARYYVHSLLVVVNSYDTYRRQENGIEIFLTFHDITRGQFS